MEKEEFKRSLIGQLQNELEFSKETGYKNESGAWIAVLFYLLFTVFVLISKLYFGDGYWIDISSPAIKILILIILYLFFMILLVILNHQISFKVYADYKTDLTRQAIYHLIYDYQDAYLNLIYRKNISSLIDQKAMSQSENYPLKGLNRLLFILICSFCIIQVLVILY